FLDSQARMKECVARSEGLPLDEVKVNSPFSSRMSYNLLSCFNILTAHERRHLWQAQLARKAIGAS
ncbi:MAG: hypothetical protein ABIS03_07845, partial [Gemmatimonadaceae bacterium]